jgi:hypothetical protein
VLERITGGQVFISCCEKDKGIHKSGKRFRVKNGALG